MRSSDKLAACRNAALLVRGHPGAPTAVKVLRSVAREAGCATRGPVEVAPETWVFAKGDTTHIMRRKPDAAEVRALLGGPSPARPPARTTTTTRTRSEPIDVPTISAERERVGRLFGGMHS